VEIVVALSVAGAVVAIITLIGLILCVVYLTKRNRRRKRGQLNEGAYTPEFRMTGAFLSIATPQL
jgi:flagellar biogenesis protein FliO